MLDISGKKLSEEDKQIISNKHVGGLILFSRNFDSFIQLKNLTDEVFNIKENIIIAVDQEGGRVQRFKNEFTEIPSMQQLANFAKDEEDINIFNDVGWLVSNELMASGVDINFAPVLDVETVDSEVIGDRSFSNTSNEVIKFGSSYIDGMHEAGMKSTGKHFPGHGGVKADSHKELPIDSRYLHELIENDIKPFKHLSKKLDAIMCAHILYSNIDNNIPSFSKKWLKNILKESLNYDGVIFSDDLSMKGAGNQNCCDKTKMALEAGCDMVIISNNRNEAINVLDYLEISKENQISKLSKMKKRKEVNIDTLKMDRRTINVKEKLQQIRK